VPYLAQLGISHCYFSPYLKTRPNSQHGYDVIDHTALNPDLGDTADYDELCRTLAEHGLNQILDIVPNHIGIMGSDSRWWLNVLEHGQASLFADYFDIDWRPVTPELENKVLVPVLGDNYGSLLVGAELRLQYDADKGELSIFYHQHRFPLDPSTYPLILQRAADSAAPKMPAGEPALIELESIIRSLNSLPPHKSSDPADREVRAHETFIAKRRLADLCASSPLIAQHVARNVATYNGIKGRRESFAPLHRLLELQAYRLAFWRVAADEINYRRFFDINDLAGLRTQNEEVLEATHRQVLTWVAEGKIQGFRIDHPDGLYDPRGYLEWLRRELTAIGRPHHYVVVEKILAAHEHLPRGWPVQGTTGYEFSAAVNGLFVYAPAERELDRAYRSLARQEEEFDAILDRCKRRILMFHLSSELTVLANTLNRIAEERLETRDFTLNAVRAVLLELIVSFPVYRTYVTPHHIGAQDRRHIEWAVSYARQSYGNRDEGILAFIQTLLLFELPDDVDEGYRQRAAAFTAKFQQLTAPVMAKALEDTSFYRHVRLLSLNEVGGDPRRFGTTPAAFHRLNQLRAKYWPHSMLGTSTHDSKRSEDVRARLNVLSELAETWRAQVAKWRRFNKGRRRSADSVAPSHNDEYLFYQTVAATWPAPGDDVELGTYRERIEAFMTKALREAKAVTSWTNPNTEYENVVLDLVRHALRSGSGNPLIADLDAFVRELATPGYLNALGQTLLKLTSPGVPDIYQGNEIWDFSLVDPDNRRPVDFPVRREMLAALQRQCASSDDLRRLLDDLQRNLADGRAKLYLTWRTLRLRAQYSDLFAVGAYLPLEVRGAHAEHVCAFARQHDGRTAMIAVGRWFTKLSERAADWPQRPFNWRDTHIVLPAAATYEHVFTGERFALDDDPPVLPAATVFARFPAALLVT
jgi:(1->4)-alpha-D-glucan 1-alpha-D-glucosylmutase